MVGLNGAGMAFFGLYVWHGVLIYILVRRLSGFRWSGANLKLGAIFLSAGALVFLAVSVLPLWPATALGVIATAIAGFYSLTELIRLLPLNWFPARLQPWLSRLAAGPAE